MGGIFKRLPVRRRELEKNIKREYGKVLNLLHAYACISNGVRFSVRNTVGKTKNVVVFSTNGNRTTKENIANVYGAKTLSALIPLDLELEFEPSAATRRAGDAEQSNKMAVRGHISRPVFGEGRQTPDRQMFFVNSRPCGLPQIAKAFNEVYKSFNVSQSPFIFADFQMDTNAYDVNVSPDKRTILLHDAGALIESLKTSLTQLFEAADQTVPQSQVLGSKTPTTKQQALGSLPGFATARQVIQRSAETSAAPRQDEDEEEPAEEEPEGSPPTVQNEIKRFMSSQGGSNQVHASSSPSKPTRISRSASRPPAAESLEQEPDFTPIEPVVGDSHEEGSQTDECVSEPLPKSSSQPAEVEETSAHQQDESEETTNVVQNAFDRMRPRRLPAEMATITIGDHTVTSMVGSGLPRKRAFDYGSSKEPPARKRRIHTPSRPNIFGKHMRAFAAPGTQTQEEDEEEEEEEKGDDDETEDSVGKINPDSEVGEEEEEGGPAPARDDTDYVPEADHDTPGNQEIDDEEDLPQQTTAGPEEDAMDEAEKKAQDEAVVQRLIDQAEETAVLPQEHNTSRANKLNKGAAHRDATVHFVGTIDASISRLQSQMAKLRECLQARGASSKEEDTDLADEKTVEDRLSLTVSKADFAQMRIIGQFNLGFILAVRPGADRDELFIIDQHASDEKFNFERLQTETVVQNQRLVRPQRLDLTAVEEEIVLENRAALEKNGFIVTVDESGDEAIGRRCQLVSLPLSKEVVFSSRDLEELIALLSESPVTNGISVPRPSKVRKMFAMRACRSSIMIGKTLTPRQMQRVVRKMGTIDKPWNCPHGRPTMRHLMSLGQWEGWDEYEQEQDEDEGRGLDVWRRYVEEDQDEDEAES